MKLSKFDYLGIAGLLVGILGVIGPILWDFYKSKSELQVSVVDNAMIIEKSKKVEGMSVTYLGEPLDDLSKTIVSLANTGRTPVLKKDVATPLRIDFPTSSQVIDVKVESRNPHDLDVTSQFNRSSGQVVFDFSLLNPGDAFTISILAKEREVDFDVSARIAGVTSLVVAKEFEQFKSPKTRSWTVYPVGAFSLILLLAAIVGVFQYRAESRVKRLLKAGAYAIPALSSRNACVKWIDSEFYFTTKAERRPFLQCVEALDDSPDFSVIHRDVLLDNVRDLTIRAIPNLQMALVVSAVAAIGSWYVLANW